MILKFIWWSFGIASWVIKSYLVPDFLSIFNLKNLLFYLVLGVAFSVVDWFLLLYLCPEAFVEGNIFFPSQIKIKDSPLAAFYNPPIIIIVGPISESLTFLPIVIARLQLSPLFFLSICLIVPIALFWAGMHKVAVVKVGSEYRILIFSWSRLHHQFRSGFIMGLVAVIGGSLWPVVLIHILHNAPTYLPMSYFVKAKKLLRIK